MNDTPFTSNFWLMTGIFVLIVLVTMIGLSFLIKQVDFSATPISGLSFASVQ